MLQALRFALFQLWRNRSAAWPVTAIMALSIGSCAAIFSVVAAVLIADLGFVEASRLAIIWHARPTSPGVVGVSPGDFISYREHLSTFDQLAAVTTHGFNFGASPSPSRVTCARMTEGMFPMLGISPAQGRWFSAEDERSGGRVVVVSHDLWTTRLGSDPGVVGRDVMLDARGYRVIGVMPGTFSFPPEGVQGLASADCWVPATFTPAELAIPAFNFILIGRLKSGVSWERAGEDAHAGAQKIWSAYPAAVQSQVQLTARVIPLEEQVVAGSRTALYLFAGSVAMLLLIGCANVSNLMLTTFDIRRRELAVRAWLGATRSMLILQLLFESIGLALSGAVGGIALAYGLLKAITAVNAAAFPRLGDATIDVTALVFAVFCGVAAGIAGGLAPAIRAGSRSVAGNETGLRSATRGFGGDRVRRGLIAFELALAMVVLVLAGVLMRSVVNLDGVDMGLEVDDVTTFSVALPPARYQHADAHREFTDRLLRQIGSLPAVRAVAAGSSLPIGEAAAGVVLPTGAVGAAYRPALVYSVTPEYAAVLGMRVRAGRFIAPTDSAAVESVAVINEALARSLWGDGNAVGRALARVGSAKPLTVIGVLADVRQAGPHRPAAPALYLSLSQSEQPIRSLSFAISSKAPSGAIGSQIRRAVAAIDGDLPAFALRSGAEIVAATFAVQRFNMLIVGIFAVFALTLAMTGLYGVVTRSIEEARRDLGIRQALGATGGGILRIVLKRGLTPALAGAVCGALAAWWAVELIASLLFGVRPGDVSTLAAALAIVLAAAFLVVLLPAMRAIRLDLVTLLKQE